MTFCQREAMELQIFFENLFRTGNPQTILQATVNTLKLDHVEKTTKTALQNLYNELQNMMDLMLPQILTEMYNSEIDRLPRLPLENVFINQVNVSQPNITNLKLMAEVANHPVAVQNQQAEISPSALIPFCSFGAKMIGAKV